MQEQGAAQPSDSIAVPPEAPVEQNAAVVTNEPPAVQNTPVPTAVPATEAPPATEVPSAPAATEQPAQNTLAPSTEEPTPEQTPEPEATAHTVEPTAEPTSEPTAKPTNVPSIAPTTEPTNTPDAALAPGYARSLTSNLILRGGTLANASLSRGDIVYVEKWGEPLSLVHFNTADGPVEGSVTTQYLEPLNDAQAKDVVAKESADSLVVYFQGNKQLPLPMIVPVISAPAQTEEPIATQTPARS